jgi:hypothetical protein
MILGTLLVCVVTVSLVASASAQRPPPKHTADSLNVTQVGSIVLTEDGIVTDLYVAGNHAYVGSAENTLYIVDISDPANMRLAAQVTTEGPALDVKVAGNLAVVGGASGITVIDISDPSSPQILSQVPVAAHNLFLYKDRAYIAHTGRPGASVLDLSDPSLPVISGHWHNDDPEFSDTVHDIFIRNDIALLCDYSSHLDFSGDGGLVIMDLADPDNPVTISSVAIPEGVHSAWWEGDYVYLNQQFGSWYRLLHVIDMSDLRRPVAIATFRARPPPLEPIEGPHNPWAQGDRLYWAYTDGGVRIFDISVPHRPVEIGYHTGPYSWGAQPHEDGLIYSTDMSRGSLASFRFHEPSHVIETASVFPGAAVVGRVSSRVTVRAATAPSPHGDGMKIAGLAATLFGVGAPAVTLLDNGLGVDAAADDGVFSASLPLPPELPTGSHRIRVELTDAGGLIYPFDLPYDVFPAQDLVLMDEALPAHWHLEGRRGAEVPQITDEGPVFHGEQVAAFRVDPPTIVNWSVHLRPPQPVEVFGYTALRFAFHPGDTEGSTLNIVLDGAPYRLVGRNDGLVDGRLREWQTVEVRLGTEPIEEISFNAMAVF